MENSYGVNRQTSNLDRISAICEDVRMRGYSIVTGQFSNEILLEARTRLEAICTQTTSEFGTENLAAIGETDVVRAALVYDDFFLHQFAAHELTRKVISRMLGDYHILHLQNGIIIRPGTPHHQGSWHRDLPYQNFVSQPALSVNAMVCLDDYKIETGCTWIVPFSHREQSVPSADYIAANCIPLEAPAGSIIFFDSMLFHRAGENVSAQTRRGLNQVYSAAIFRQQIDLPKALNGRHAEDSYFNVLLGYSSHSPHSVQEYRERRMQRNKGKK